MSDPGLVHCGVPQGSALGPLLFLIYINDMPRVVNESVCALYADDTVLYVTGKHHELMVNKLQSDLQRIESWLIANKLHVNAAKCKVMMISTAQNLNRQNPINVTINGTPLEQVSEYKYRVLA